MKNALSLAHKASLRYALWFTPLALLDIYLTWDMDAKAAGLLGVLSWLTLAWAVSVVLVPFSLIFDAGLRERLLSRLTGFREGDERERLVTAEAARTAFLLTLAVNIVLLIMSLTSFHVVRSPDGHGLLALGLGFESSRHLDVFGLSAMAEAKTAPGLDVKGYLMTPGSAPVLFGLILLQVIGFRALSRRRYEGIES